MQHHRLPCLSTFPWVCSNSCPLSQWWYLAISFSAATISCCPQSFPESGSFPMCWLFASSGQSVGASTSVSIFPMNIQDWFPYSPRNSQESSPALQCKNISYSVFSLLYGPTLISVHDYGKNHSLTMWNFVCKVMFLLFSMLSRFVIVSLNSMTAVIILSDFGAQENEICLCFHFFLHLFAMQWWNVMTLVFWMLSFKSVFLFFSFTFTKRPFSSSTLPS